MGDGDERAAAAVPPYQRVDRRGGPRGASPAWGVPGSEVQVLAVIAAGGMAGAAARHGIGLAIPTAAGGLPWSTFIVNASGCLLIGVVMVFTVEARHAHRLVRPFVAVGVLGGYTTLSTYAVDAQVLISAGRPGVALAYLAGTAVAALVAVELGVVLTRALALPRPQTRTARRAAPRGDTE